MGSAETRTMGNWPATKARRVVAALERIGWSVKRQSACPGLPGTPVCGPTIYNSSSRSGRAYYISLRSTLSNRMSGVIGEA